VQATPYPAVGAIMHASANSHKTAAGSRPHSTPAPKTAMRSAVSPPVADVCRPVYQHVEEGDM